MGLRGFLKNRTVGMHAKLVEESGMTSVDDLVVPEVLQADAPKAETEANVETVSTDAKPVAAETAAAQEQTVVCPKCKKTLNRDQVIANKYVCYECGNYFRVRTKNRIAMIADHHKMEYWFTDLPTSNPLEDSDYEEKLQSARDKTGLDEAVTVGLVHIFGEPAVVGICDARFMMASMGHIVGEKITRAVEEATKRRLPVFLFCCSGGARMQEGIISLMQMEKTSAALKRHSDAGLLYCSILTDPTTGGVTASFATLGDVILAEPGALIGFAGPRVIKQTIGRELPKGFQTAEFLLEHGMVDGIIDRRRLKKMLYFLIVTHKGTRDYPHTTEGMDALQQMSELVKEHASKEQPTDAWTKVRKTRDINRPSASDYIRRIFDLFVEAHGDRVFGDDHALIGGIGILDGQPVTIIADEKGSDIKECKERNFGMPMAEGYRKAIRLMKQAEKFNRPIISFINTPGAFCGLEAEERGIGSAIAQNLYEMSNLKVPVLCIMIGEGGSGGALGTAVGNEVWMLENATYSILSPEGYASILWKDSSRCQEAAEAMKITAEDLKRLGVIEQVLPEFGGADKDTVDAIAANMREKIIGFVEAYKNISPEEIAEQRYQRFRAF